jgi:hypothetical protein
VDHRSGLVFLANTLRKSMYVLNLEHGTDRSTPAAFTYLAEFSFTAPILSFTTLNEGLVDGEETVEIYTVQPEKIQRYALDASLVRKGFWNRLWSLLKPIISASTSCIGGMKLPV